MWGRIFVAASIAAFGAEHFAIPGSIMQIVPAWIPNHLFWTYFVAVALLAAAASFVLDRYVRLSATLLGAMFLIFVLTIHLPRLLANPRDRIAWAVFLRDLAFAGGGWALAGGRLAAAGRIWIGIAALFFGIEHLLHPAFAPGVPLPMRTPAWVPLRALWGDVMGALLLVAGASALFHRYVRFAAALLGVALLLAILVIYIPNMARAPSLEAFNYVADTLLFAGTVLLLAGAK